MQKGFSVDPWFEAISAAVHVGPLVLSPKKEPDFVGPGALQLLGYASEAEFKHDWPELLKEMGDVLDFSEPGSEPLTARRRDIIVDVNGEARRLRVEAYLLDESDCEGFMVILKDRHSLDQLQNNLRSALRADTLQLVFDRVIHDLRSPLNAMALNVSLLADTPNRESAEITDKALMARQARYVRLIASELDRLRDMLAAVTRVGQSVLHSGETERIELRELIGDLLTFMTQQARANNVQLHFEPPKQPMYVYTAADTVKEILVNLINNAIEAQPEGGTVKLSLRTRENKVLLNVQDEGPGVDADARDSVFKLHAGTKKGGGLGLYVSKHLASSIGGDLKLQPPTGSRGAAFTLTLPTEK